MRPFINTPEIEQPNCLYIHLKLKNNHSLIINLNIY